MNEGRRQQIAQLVQGEPLADRAAHLRRLADRTFDILVIGGGATGAGVALDAVTRGFSVGLIERADFASGTSSRSTSHGPSGVQVSRLLTRRLGRYQFSR